MKLLFYSLIILFIFSCQKKPATNIDQKLIGNWKHSVNTNEHIYIQIGENSRGSFTIYDSAGNTLKGSSDQLRKWMIKNDALYFGRSSSKNQRFKINQYPLTSSDTIINDFDTIYPENSYLILNGVYFVDQN